MIGSFFRIVFGFVLACLAAGLTQVGFVNTPLDLAQLNSYELAERLPTLGTLALLTATHTGIFSFLLALPIIVIAEWQRVRASHFYALAGLAVAGAGFYAQYSSESAGGPTIFNPYALAAFLTSGVVGGIVYWLFAGRKAGGRRAASRSFANERPPENGSGSDHDETDEPGSGEVRIRRVEASKIAPPAEPGNGEARRAGTKPASLASVPGIKRGPGRGSDPNS